MSTERRMEIQTPDTILFSVQNSPMVAEVVNPPRLYMMANECAIAMTMTADAQFSMVAAAPIQATISNMSIEFLLSIVGERGLTGDAGALKATPITTSDFNDLVDNGQLIPYAAYFDTQAKILHIATSTTQHRAYLAVWKGNTPPPDAGYIWLTLE